MYDTRYSQLSSDNRYRVVFGSHRELAPELEVMRFTTVVQGESDAAIEEHDCALDRRHLHGNEVAIKGQDRKR
jgi:hypothetical protein